MEKIRLNLITNNLDNKRIPLNGQERLQKQRNPLYPYIGANNIMGYIDEYIFDEKIICIAEDGGSWGKNETCSKIYNEKVWVNNHAHVLTAKDDLHLEYLMYYLNWTDLTLFINGATRGKLTQASLNSIEIPLPPLPTQKAIAAKLDKAQEIISYNKQLIEKYDQLTQSLFIDMFGDPVRNDKGFLKSTIGEQCSVKGGKRVPKNEKLVKHDTGFPYIKAGNIKKGKVTTKDLEYLLPTTREKLKRYIVNEGDVCITVVGVNIGDIGIVPKELHLANLTENANKLLIKTEDLLNSFYLASYLQMDFIQQDISKKTMAVGVPKLALFRIEQLELLLPPIELQVKFQKNVELVETQKQMAQESLAKSEALFQSLLQESFK